LGKFDKSANTTNTTESSSSGVVAIKVVETMASVMEETMTGSDVEAPIPDNPQNGDVDHKEDDREYP
jgi:hypothetical protein